MRDPCQAWIEFSASIQVVDFERLLCFEGEKVGTIWIIEELTLWIVFHSVEDSPPQENPDWTIEMASRE